jgi:hypothetical protein
MSASFIYLYPVNSQTPGILDLPFSLPPLFNAISPPLHEFEKHDYLSVVPRRALPRPKPMGEGGTGESRFYTGHWPFKNDGLSCITFYKDKISYSFKPGGKDILFLTVKSKRVDKWV